MVAEEHELYRKHGGLSEEDRRRIRRDLHDGLGPVLGGVAMRLDAAGNALDRDPESTRRLVAQSRQLARLPR